MNTKSLQLKPQDILVLLRLLIWKEDRSWIFSELAKDLGMSQSEVHQALKRAKACDLYDPLTRRPKRNFLLEFLSHGIRFVFPSQVNGVVKGVPTAHSVKPLNKKIVSNQRDCYVWSYPQGRKKGISVTPLYPSVPKVALKFPELYELLALIDALRIGKLRERKLAQEEIKKRLLSE